MKKKHGLAFFTIEKLQDPSISQGMGSKISLSSPDQKYDVRKTFQSMCGVLLLCFPLGKEHHAQYFRLKDNAKTIFCAQFCIVSLNICMCTNNHLTLILPSFRHSSTFQLLACLLAKARISEHVYTIRFKLKNSLRSSLKNNTMQVLSPCN